MVKRRSSIFCQIAFEGGGRGKGLGAPTTCNAPINVKPHPTQYGLCGALGGDLNLNFAPRGGEFEQALYSSIDPLQ